MWIRGWMAGGLLCAVATAALAQRPAEFKLVPAELYHQRDGLGNVLAKLKAGREVRIAYFGGSITAANGWRPMTLKWFQERYPDTTVSQINAAIGGTPSALGAYRCGQDVLAHEPDLVFVEFAVNDGNTPQDDIWRAMEGIVRQIWTTDPTIDICYVYTFRSGFEKDLDQGLCPHAASAHEYLAEYYGIPSINMAVRVAEQIRDGKLLIKPELDDQGKAKPPPAGVNLFTDGDGVHPNPYGHSIYLDVISQGIAQWEATANPGPHTLKAPFIADNWERATIVPVQPSMLSGGWHQLSPDEGLGRTFSNRMTAIWEANAPGETIEFRFKGTAVSLYDLLGPDGGQVMITLDGTTRGPVPRFDSYCTYHRLAWLGIGNGLEDAVHTVKVEIHPDQPDRSSVTDREKDKPNFDPKRYDGHGLRVGGIMLIGELVD